MKPTSRKGRKMGKAVGRSPKWLKTVIIAKTRQRARIKGTFGAASECVSVKPTKDAS